MYILIFITGLIFGSFSSVVIHRLHSGEKGILLGRSKCPKCNNILQPRDLIPVLSFVINKFKCRFCKKPIPSMYPLLELLMGGSFLLTTYLVGIDDIKKLTFYLFITFVFVLLSVYDGLYKEVPDEISLPTILISFFGIWLLNIHSIESILTGLLIPVLFFGSLFIFSRGKWLGGGDVRIGAMMGILLGWPNIIIGLFVGYALGSVFSIGGIIIKKLSRKSQIPFAPFLFIGTYIAMFWGKDILDWYMGGLF